MSLNIDSTALEWTSIFKRLKILKILAFIEALIVLYLAFVFSKDAIMSLAAGVFVGVLFYRLLSSKLFARQKGVESELLRAFLEQNGGKFTPNFNEMPLNSLFLNTKIQNAKFANAFDFENFTLYDARLESTAGRAFVGVLLVLKKGDFRADLASIKESEVFERLDFKGKAENFSGDFSTARLFISGENALKKADENVLNKANEKRVKALKKASEKNLEKIDEKKLEKVDEKILKKADEKILKVDENAKIALIPTLSNPFFISPKRSLKQNLKQMQANLEKIHALMA